MKASGDAQRELSVAVIGAGILGSSVALALAEEGYQVTVLDSRSAGTGTSSGNAGAIVTGSVTPTATPAVIRAIPSYLLQPDSPAVLRPAYALHALPWLTRFIAAGSRSRVEQISAALAPLVSNSMIAHRALTGICGANSLIAPAGWLKVYATDAGFADAALERELMATHDVDFKVLNAEQVAELEPKLERSSYRFGVFQPNCGFVDFPMKLAQTYVNAAVERGARILPYEVLRVSPHSEGGVRITTDAGTHDFDKVVVAAGAWSKEFVQQIGDKVSLDTERGYHISFGPGSSDLLNRPVVYPERGFVLSPMHDGVQLTSGDELAGLHAAPNYKRIRALIPVARNVLPGIADTPIQREWMGFRPSTPDSLPVIGRSPRCRDVLYAFGHGHLGLTMAAITAQIITDLVRNRPSRLDLSPYRVERFQGVSREVV